MISNRHDCSPQQARQWFLVEVVVFPERAEECSLDIAGLLEGATSSGWLRPRAVLEPRGVVLAHGWEKSGRKFAHIYLWTCADYSPRSNLGYKCSGGDCELEQSEEKRQGAMECSSVVRDPHKSQMKTFIYSPVLQGGSRKSTGLSSQSAADSLGEVNEHLWTSAYPWREEVVLITERPFLWWFYSITSRFR